MDLLTLASDGLKGIAPRSLWRPRPLIEIGEYSLHKEPSAGRDITESCGSEIP
jgi:hypothetical protein